MKVQFMSKILDFSSASKSTIEDKVGFNLWEIRVFMAVYARACTEKIMTDYSIITGVGVSASFRMYRKDENGSVLRAMAVVKSFSTFKGSMAYTVYDNRVPVHSTQNPNNAVDFLTGLLPFKETVGGVISIEPSTLHRR